VRALEVRSHIRVGGLSPAVDEFPGFTEEAGQDSGLTPGNLPLGDSWVSFSEAGLLRFSGKNVHPDSA
jgi:hypothetical protein